MAFLSKLRPTCNTLKASTISVLSFQKTKCTLFTLLDLPATHLLFASLTLCSGLCRASSKATKTAAKPNPCLRSPLSLLCPQQHCRNRFCSWPWASVNSPGTWSCLCKNHSSLELKRPRVHAPSWPGARLIALSQKRQPTSKGDGWK